MCRKRLLPVLVCTLALVLARPALSSPVYDDYYRWFTLSFDASLYLAQYADLRAAFGQDANDPWVQIKLLQHWFPYGIQEGRRASSDFDVRFYVSRYLDLQAFFGADMEGAWIHWMAYGIDEGRRGSAEFDVRSYLGAYPDLEAAFGTNYRAAWEHWLTYGIQEGRRGSPEFDVQFYLDEYPDLRAAFAGDFEAAFEHWVAQGIREGRRGSSEFDAWFYLNQYPDLAAAFALDYQAALKHWVVHGIQEGRRGSLEFDASFYLDEYPDLAAAFGADHQAALEHWVHYGSHERRRGSSFGFLYSLQNESFATNCAEVDNIQAVFRSDTTTLPQFAIRATHPRYLGAQVTDNCGADFTGCSVAERAASGFAASALVSCSERYNDGTNVLSVCTDSNWWRPGTMTVRVPAGGFAAHFLKLNRKIDDANSWPEVLVLYQDGNLRLKPHAPAGRSDVCFGSSVVIGPTDIVSAARPYSEISEVAFDSKTLCLTLSYVAGGTSRLCLDVNRSEANLRVESAHALAEPFAVFRSMWVGKGLADADTVESFDSTGDPILSGWDYSRGPGWRFSRRVLSSHNTSAPDLEVTLGRGISLPPY